MPKTMTFERAEYELIRKLLRTELKRAQTALDRAQTSGKSDYHVDRASDHRDMVAKLLQEAQLPVMVTRVNLMSGQEYQEAEDTPNSCSPASETYWSM